MTDSSTTWVPDFSSSVSTPDQTETGIVDVHSGSNLTSTEGTLYSTW
jgi:hypothetical protein